MNQIERLRDDLTKRFPSLRINIDAPAADGDSWFLDIHRDDASPVVVEWRFDRGFGISTPGSDDYGSGPDEVYSNTKAAYEQVVSLILSCGLTEPPQAVWLAELRQIQGLSQGELAVRAGVRQANISRIESRGDIKVSTLIKIISAMGGVLSIRARFSDGVERELNVESLTADLPPKTKPRYIGSRRRRRNPKRNEEQGCPA